MVLPQLVRIKRIALEFVFPQWCIGCGKGGDVLCSSCQSLLPGITPPICPRCGKPQPDGMLCPSCTGWQAEIDGIRSPFRFDGLMRQAIHQLKYKNLRALVTPMTKLLHDYLTANPLPGDVLVPVPLHPRRLRERGHNQSGLLAQELSRLAGLPVIEDCLARKQHTPPQARTTTVEERRSNVANAFTCVNDKLNGKQVLLIDDVSTSGATLSACATELKAGGAVSVWGLTLAREV